MSWIDYMNAEEFFWFWQFQSADKLRRMCALLEEELKEEHVECPTKKDAVNRLDELAHKRFARAIYGRDFIMDISVVGQLKDWWKEKKKAGGDKCPRRLK